MTGLGFSLTLMGEHGTKHITAALTRNVSIPPPWTAFVIWMLGPCLAAFHCVILCWSWLLYSAVSCAVIYQDAEIYKGFYYQWCIGMSCSVLSKYLSVILCTIVFSLSHWPESCTSLVQVLLQVDANNILLPAEQRALNVWEIWRIARVCYQPFLPHFCCDATATAYPTRCLWTRVWGIRLPNWYFADPTLLNLNQTYEQGTQGLILFVWSGSITIIEQFFPK